MIRFKYSTLIFTLIIAVVALGSTVQARIDTLNVEITPSDYYYGPDSTQARCVLNIPVPEPIRGKELIFAELFVPVFLDSLGLTSVDVFCFPLKSEFEPGGMPEGDEVPQDMIGPDGAHFVSSTIGEQQAYFDVTRLMQSWISGEMDNNGILLFTGADNTSHLRLQSMEGRPVKLAIYCEH